MTDNFDGRLNRFEPIFVIAVRIVLWHCRLQYMYKRQQNKLSSIINKSTREKNNNIRLV